MSGRLGPSLRASTAALGGAIVAASVSGLCTAWWGGDVTLMLLAAAAGLLAWRGGRLVALTAAVAGWLACEAVLRAAGAPDGLSLAQVMGFLAVSGVTITLGEALRRARAAQWDEQIGDSANGLDARAALAAIVENSDDAIISKSLQGVIRSWNPGAERLFGYSAEEAIGRPVSLIVPPELRQVELSILEKLRRGERVEPFQTVRADKEGRRIDVSLAISPIRNQAGRVIGASKIARDVTQQKRAEAALRFSEERFRELANHIDQFAWTCDELGYATWYNQRWYEYTGASIEEMRGDGWKAYHDPAHVERVTATLARCVATGEPWEDTFPLRGKDGGYRWFLSRAVPIRDERGLVVRWFGTNTDITEQRKLEQELKAADKRKDEFLATLAHELRNPLAPLRNALEILNLAGDDPRLIAQAKAIMDRQMSHLVRLVEDLLDVSRITRDRLELRTTDVELIELVKQTADAHRGLMEEHGLHLELSLPDRPIPLQADAVRLEQILSNLLNNAARYTPQGGQVWVSVQRAGRDVLIRVRDTGVGIPAAELNGIFDMFAQVQEDRSVHGGLGIGLTLVKRLTELHGGSVSACSEGPGQGSEFTVRLPVAAGSADGGEDFIEPAAGAPAAARRVLVVEDNPDTAATLATLLHMAGHQTEVAHDGPQAMEAAETFRPDVILLDLGLPGLNGVEVCRWIREQPWGAGVTVVAVTGWGQEADRRRTAEAGFDDHLVKPVGPETVLSILASAPRAEDARAVHSG